MLCRQEYFPISLVYRKKKALMQLKQNTHTEVCILRLSMDLHLFYVTLTFILNITTIT